MTGMKSKETAYFNSRRLKYKGITLTSYRSLNIGIKGDKITCHMQTFIFFDSKNSRICFCKGRHLLAYLNIYGDKYALFLEKCLRFINCMLY